MKRSTFQDAIQDFFVNSPERWRQGVGAALHPWGVTFQNWPLKQGKEEGSSILNTSSPGLVCFEKFCVSVSFLVSLIKTGAQKHIGRRIIFRIVFLPFTTFSCLVEYFYKMNVYLSKVIILLSDLPKDYSWHSTGDSLCMPSIFSKIILPPIFQGSWCYSSYLNFHTARSALQPICHNSI